MPQRGRQRKESGSSGWRRSMRKPCAGSRASTAASTRGPGCAFSRLAVEEQRALQQCRAAALLQSSDPGLCLVVPTLYSCCWDNKRLWLGSIAETISFVHGCSSWMFRLQGCRPGTGGSEIRSAAGSPAAPAPAAAPMPAAQPGSAADPQSCSVKQASVGGLAASKHGGQSAGELSDGPAACRYAALPPPPPPSLPDTQRGRQCQRATTQPDDHHPAAERVW